LAELSDVFPVPSPVVEAVVCANNGAIGVVVNAVIRGATTVAGVVVELREREMVKVDLVLLVLVLLVTVVVRDEVLVAVDVEQKLPVPMAPAGRVIQPVGLVVVAEAVLDTCVVLDVVVGEVVRVVLTLTPVLDVATEVGLVVAEDWQMFPVPVAPGAKIMQLAVVVACADVGLVVADVIVLGYV
jgi:hypothetical protein